MNKCVLFRPYMLMMHTARVSSLDIVPTLFQPLKFYDSQVCQFDTPALHDPHLVDNFCADPDFVGTHLHLPVAMRVPGDACL